MSSLHGLCRKDRPNLYHATGSRGSKIASSYLITSCKMGSAPYKLVEFTGETLKGKKKSIDFVPRMWIKYNADVGELVTQFMPPPYDEENVALLQSLVECRAPAPEDWPEFTIHIRGEANSYAEASKKLKVLFTKAYAYSTDTEQTGHEKALAAAKEFKLPEPEEEGENCWDVPDLVNSKIVSDHVSSDAEEVCSNNRKKRQNLRSTKPKAKNSAEKVLSSSDNSKSQEKAPNKHVHNTASVTAVSKKANSKLTPAKKDRDDDGKNSGLSKLKSALRSTSATSKLSKKKALSPEKSEDDDEAIDSDNSEAENAALTKKKTKALPKKTTFKTQTSKTMQCRENSEDNAAISPSNIVPDTPSSLPGRVKQKEMPATSKTPSPKKKNDDFRKSYAATARKAPLFSKPLTSMEELTDYTDAAVLFDDVVPVINPLQSLEDVKLLISKGFRSQCIQLTRISEQLDELKILMKERSRDGIPNIKVKDFEETWNLILPIKTLEDFLMFDEKLENDQVFREDVISSMWASVDRSVPIGNSVRGVLKKFMSRDVTQHYTTVKNMGKQVLCKTKFYFCARAVIVAKYKENKNAPEISEKDFEHAVAKVMNNAKDWEGHRTARTKK